MSDQQPAAPTAPAQDPAADPAPPRRRRRGTAGDMVRSLLVVLVLVFVVVALNAQPEPDPKVRRFDYTAALAQARERAPYDVVAPAGLPRAWKATSARSGRASDAVTWHIGFVTPAGDYAALEQSDGDPENFVTRIAGDADDAGTVRINGVAWRRLEGGDEPRALVLDAAPVTTVVAGGASWRELRALAAALPTL